MLMITCPLTHVNLAAYAADYTTRINPNVDELTQMILRRLTATAEGRIYRSISAQRR